MAQELLFNDEVYVETSTEEANMSNCNADCTVHCH